MYIEAVEDGLSLFQLVDKHVNDKNVCRRRRGKECETLGVSTCSLSVTYVCGYEFSLVYL